MANVPDDELTDEELDHVAAWLAKHGPHSTCPGCGSEDWAVDPGWRRSKRQVPFVQVYSPCGYTAFFSAITLGIKLS